MVRLRNKLTGVVVDVDDATAARLGRKYESLVEPEQAEPKTPAPRRRTARSK